METKQVMIHQDFQVSGHLRVDRPGTNDEPHQSETTHKHTPVDDGTSWQPLPDGPGGEEGVRPRAELHELHGGEGSPDERDGGSCHKSTASPLRGRAGRDRWRMGYIMSCGWMDRGRERGCGWGGTGQDPNARMGLLGTARKGPRSQLEVTPVWRHGQPREQCSPACKES